MSEEILLSNLSNGVLTLTLNRPKANAFNSELIKALRNAIRQAGKDEATRVVLLAASGGIFSAGQDVKEFGGDGHLSFRNHLQKTYNPLILTMRKLEKPILCAVNGAVAGAALGIVLACDLRIASEAASFYVGFGGIGLAPDSAVSLMLPKIIGLGRAAEASYFNSPISAQQALDWGLANRLAAADELGDAAKAWATELAKGPVKAMGLAKRDFNKAHLSNLEEQLDYEAHIQEIAGQGPDHKEGLAAFLEKREADYIGQ
ncbi:MAG: 2-(1,2-epoxy-1,2-dihydrophenyl)acetyl-CoA isomerase [Chloroflexi bacterium]|nr:MAG: 2-(1,2-epoxy-1,2-dihydrophenyl)acetyl-CoA isomerase [Chloroflexota bacterium]MBL1192874.1 2-(1,2-epoxy-1,2-dihydrophenyl)acetyl-CoA isomerase [Chloroflexota bacterium]NOH10167.1 2-(1,2-epoxy-1,2-dihydrophenyl)acetyl-CoA isomerase [Chloroflexota bacterium]